VSRPGRDPASWVLSGAVRLLPAARREWGTAMRAELAGIGTRRARWRFTSGCVRAVATRPEVLGGLGYPLLATGVMAAVLGWTGAIAYAPLRWGLVTLVAILVAVSWLGRRPGIAGPVGASRPARLVRAGGYLLVGTLTMGVVASLGDGGGSADRATFGVPILTVVLTGYLLGFLTLTARRSAATTRVLAAGVTAGVVAAAAWTVTVLAAPPIPASIAPAFTLTVAAMGAAAFATVGSPGDGEGGLLAALCAGTVATLLLVILVGVLSTFAPPGLIPDLAPAALSPADDLAQSRIEVQDPYVAMLALGGLLAAILSLVSVSTRAAAPTGSAPIMGSIRPDSTGP
jgi:hypothetical protein